MIPTKLEQLPQTILLVLAATLLIAFVGAQEETPTPFRRTAAPEAKPAEEPATAVSTPMDLGPLELQVLDLAETLSSGSNVRRAEGQPHPIRERNLQITDLLRRFCEPRLEEAEGMELVGPRHLAVLARPEVHKWVRDMLARAKAAAKDLYEFEVHICSVDQSVLEQVCAPLEAASGEAGLTARIGGTSEVSRDRNLRLMVDANTTGTELLRRLKDLDTAELISAPRMAVHTLQLAELKIVEQHSYITDFEVKRMGENAIADPIIDVVEDGVTVEAIAAPLANGWIGLQARVHIKDLQLPIPQLTTKLPGLEREVTIQLPRWTSVRFEQDLVLPENQMAVIGAPDGMRYMLVAITARKVKQQDRGVDGRTIRRRR